MKRLFDLSVSVVLVVLLAVPLAVVAALIALTDGRPILFRQDRIGLNGVPFRIFKFRTMKTGSERDGTTTVAGDRRLIAIAPFLRATKLDELPQLFNIIGGTMSLVGPRPTTEDDVARMSPAQRNRHKVLPGITGLAQINGDSSISWPRRIEYDLQYVERQSFWLDLKILCRTAALLITGKINRPPLTGDEWADP